MQALSLLLRKVFTTAKVEVSFMLSIVEAYT